MGGTRKPRVVFDAIARSTNANPAAAAGEIAKAEKAIRAAEADTIAKNVTRYLIENPQVDEVPTGSIELWLVARVEQRAARYREMRPTWELTPSSLAKHWLRIPTWTHDRGDRGGLSASELMEVDLG